MISIRLHSLPLAFFAMLALISILLAPVAAAAHKGGGSSTAASSADCSHCKSHQHQVQKMDHQKQQQDDCCRKTACPCACHAPLVAYPPLLSVPSSLSCTFMKFIPNKPPQVYFTIDPPPQKLI